MKMGTLLVAVGLAVAQGCVVFGGPGGSVAPSEQEPSAVWTQPDTLLVGYNDETPGGATTMGWAFSNNGGVTWKKCASNNPGNCNTKPIDTGLVGKSVTFVRHPAVATDGLGNGVYVTLADTDGSPDSAERVVGMISTDGGKTFGAAQPLNADSCDNGEQDMPHAAFDYTPSPATLWVVWRHRGVTQGGSFGGCIRRFFIQPMKMAPPKLTPLDDAHSVDGMDLEDITGSQGGLKVQAGDGVVTVVYSNTDHVFTCPDTSLRGLAWASVSTFDNGHHWVDNDRIFHTESFRWCVLGTPPVVQNSIRAFDFVRTMTGFYYVVVNDAVDTIRLFMSPAAGTKGRIGPGDTTRNWFEWCPKTETAPGDPQTPVWNWHAPFPFLGTQKPDEPCAAAFYQAPGGVALLPSISADANDRLSISFYENDPMSPGSLIVSYAGNVNPNEPNVLGGPDFRRTPTSVPVAGPFGLPAPLSTPAKTVFQPLGSLVSMTPRTPTGSVTEPGCGVAIAENATFYPFWVQRSGTSPQIATRQMFLTP